MMHPSRVVVVVLLYQHLPSAFAGEDRPMNSCSSSPLLTDHVSRSVHGIVGMLAEELCSCSFPRAEIVQGRQRR